MPHFPSTAAEEPRSLPVRSCGNHQNLSDQDGREERIKVKNRRKRYIDLHPEYLKSDDLELAEPLLYDRFVRSFQTNEEREKEGRERGYTGVLEADLVRSEAKLASLRHPDPNSPIIYRRNEDGSINGAEQDDNDRVLSREDGWNLWSDHMRQRFMRGDDHDFDYTLVDNNEGLDDRAEEEREHLESYLQGEEARFEGDGSPKGETGIQDF